MTCYLYFSGLGRTREVSEVQETKLTANEVLLKLFIILFASIL